MPLSEEQLPLQIDLVDPTPSQEILCASPKRMVEQGAVAFSLAWPVLIAWTFSPA
jgi:hypothetical protein